VNRASWSGVTIDCLDPVRVGTFWCDLLDRESSAAMPGWVRLGTYGQAQPVLNFQPVSEPKRDKVRIHLDVTVDDIDDGIQRVLALGGRSLGQRHDYPGEGVVVVMADPEDNEFCLVQYFTNDERATSSATA
jgi:predicted enzyme related to lactoylglutathione lyase